MTTTTELNNSKWIMTIEDDATVSDYESDDSSLDQQQASTKEKNDISSNFLFSMHSLDSVTALQDQQDSVMWQKGARPVWDFDAMKDMMSKGGRGTGGMKTSDGLDAAIKKYRIVEKVTEPDTVNSDCDYSDFDGELSDLKENVDDDQNILDDKLDDNLDELQGPSKFDIPIDDDKELQDKVLDKKKMEYFAPAEPEQASQESLQSFTEMNLSRPLLKGLTDVGFVQPTKIQAMTIPIALMGKDICGGAVTGSGKTAAFLIPIFERLLYRPKNVAVIRVLIMTPTRELAAQCYSVAVKLAKYTDLSFALCVGGMSTQQQEQELKKRPDVVIATPGRLIDHVRNSASFSLDGIEILVMDEADRMLEEGFEAELTEVIKSCPHGRQTLLFSATMTDNVSQLVRLSLTQPVRLFLDASGSVADNLVQEFIRVRTTADVSGTAVVDAMQIQRECILLALCMRTYRARVIVFFPTKVECHRMKVVFGLYGLKAAELHGNLTQLQRIQSLEQFRDNSVDFLLATDVAARGLDITGVETVINFQMPNAYDKYIHRVGRTARYHRSGCAVTLVSEKERKMVKTIVKNLKPGQVVKQRLVPAAVLQKYRNRIVDAETSIQQVLIDEKTDRVMEEAEMGLKKAENLLEHADTIYGRPARTWFQSAEEKKEAKRKGHPNDAKRARDDDDDNLDDESDVDDHYSKFLAEETQKIMGQPVSRNSFSGLNRKQKRKKMMKEGDDAAEFHAAQTKQIACAKSAKKASLAQRHEGVTLGNLPKKSKKSSKKLKPSFDKDLGSNKKTNIMGGKAGRKVEAKSGGKKPHVKGGKKGRK